MNVCSKTGMHLLLEPDEGFTDCLPRSGTVENRIREDVTGVDWHVVKLDEPVEYQMKIGEPYQYRLVRSDYLLIRSRWQGHDVGMDEPTSVHILLPLREQVTKQGILDLKDVCHVGWARCSRA